MAVLEPGDRQRVRQMPPTADVVEQMAALAELGFTSAGCNLAAVRRSSMAEGRCETVDGFAEVIGSMRSC